MIAVAEARRFVLAACPPLPPLPVELNDACGLVLAGAVTSQVSVPPFANSAMDGYALRAADTIGAPTYLRVLGSVMAGDEPRIAVGPGEAVRIMTGAALPRGADAVCAVELTHAEDGGMTAVIGRTVAAGANVRLAGEDVAVGAEVFSPGTVITPAHVGVLASLGLEAVVAHARPRVAVLSTGDELVQGPEPLRPGKIYDANRPALIAQLRAEGWEATDLGVVGDDETELARAFEHGACVADAVVATGGVSVGDRDVVKVVLDRLSDGAMQWMQVAIKPGKPFAFGTMAGTATPLFGLPGNPVAALVSYELFVRPALRAMAGHRRLDRPRLSALADDDIAHRGDGTLRLVRVVASTDASGSVHVRLSGGQGSHMLRAMADANALALVNEEVEAGACVEVLLLDADRLAPSGVAGMFP